MLWNSGIHSMANGGRKLCKNDQNKFINKGDLRNDNDMTICRMVSKNEGLWLTAQFTCYGMVMVSHSQVSNIRICYDNFAQFAWPKR